MQPNLSATAWDSLSRLLDEALDLDVPAREAWLQRQSAAQPALASTLRRLLAAHATSETDDLLARLPTVAVLEGDEAAPGLSAGDRVGPYRLLRELGRGGMADVWLAERADGAFEREVALKLPRINRLRTDLAPRFARERAILARLEHPHIARLYDAGVAADGLPYLAMEFVDGRPIDAYCDAERLDVAARLQLFAQVLDAVQYAHANLVIHRDLKPSNILVGSDGQVRLLDFGIAKLLGDEDSAAETQLTQVSGRALTPDYASPEQVKGEPLTIASDVYSLGVVLYELLTGQRPYRLRHASTAQLEEAIVSADPPWPSSAVGEEASRTRSSSKRQLARALHGDLDTIVLKALAKAPTQRYAAVAALAEDLQRHLQGLPVLARPDAFTYRARKYVLRHKAEAAIAAGVLLAVVGGAYAQVAVAAALAAGGGVALWQVRVARRQAQQASEQARRAEEVKEFVLSILRDANAEHGGGRQVTAVDLLGQGVKRLDATPVANAATLVELQTAIGTGLRGIGEFRLSIEILKQAVDTARARLGETHPRTVTALLELASTALYGGDLVLAETSLHAAERGARRLGDDKRLAAALHSKATLCRQQGHGGELALELAKQAVEVAERHAAKSGDQEPLIYAMIEQLGVMRELKLDGQLPLARRAHNLVRRFHGDRPVDFSLDVHMLHGLAQVKEGDADSGLAELKEVLEQRRQLSGDLHQSVASVHGSIGAALASAGDIAGAIEAFRERLRIGVALSNGKPIVPVANAAYNVGMLLAIAQRYDEALSELRHSDATYAALAVEHSMRSMTLSAIMMVLTQIERIDEADALFVALPPPTDAYQAATIKARLGMLRSAQGQHAEALALLRASAEAFEQQSLPDYQAVALLYLGRALVADAQAAPALEALRRARAILAPRHRKGSPYFAALDAASAQAELALGHHAAALAAAERAVVFWESFDPANRETGLASLWQARALIAGARAADAQAPLQHAETILTATARPSDRALLEQTQHDLHAALQQHG